jgi:hypothetical protein
MAFMKLKSLRTLLLVVGLSAVSSPAFAEEPLLSPEDTALFHEQANQIIQEARIASGQVSTIELSHDDAAYFRDHPDQAPLKMRHEKNETPYTIYVPDGPQVYAAFFPRDSNMTLGADFISLNDVQGWIKLMAATIPNADWQVRPGILVPAYSLPDHIYYNGKPAFYPGPARGNDQGGGSFGPMPPLDDAYFFLFTVCQQADMARNTDFFKSKVATPAGLVALPDVCLKVFDATTCDPVTGLVTTGDINGDRNAHDFGFCDGVFKSGLLLFTSVLRYDAATRLAPLYREIGDADTANRLEKTAATIKKNLGMAFYHEGANPGEGWLNSATGFSNQPDVWGSAYAVEIGAVDAETAAKVGRAILRGYQDHATVIHGWVTQVLPNDPAHPNGWMKSTCGFGDYQNGGYWGVGTGWYILALNKVDPAAARAMTKDYVDYLKASMGPDGVTKSWEVVNKHWSEFQHPHYLATISFPYGLLNRAGLLPAIPSAKTSASP